MSEVIDISPGNLDPACASSSPVFLMMYSAMEVVKQQMSRVNVNILGISELEWVNGDDPEGWDGEGGGRWGSGWGTHVHLWLIHVNVWQKSLQYCKVISFQLK